MNSDCVKDFKAFKSKYAKTKQKVTPTQHLKLSIDYAEMFTSGEVDPSQLAKINTSIQKQIHNKKPRVVQVPSSDSEAESSSDAGSESSFLGSESKGQESDYSTKSDSDTYETRRPGLMKFVMHVDKFEKSRSKAAKVLDVHKCAEVDLSLPVPNKSLEAQLQDIEAYHAFASVYIEFLAILKELKSTPAQERHTLTEALQRQLSLFNGCECDDNKLLVMLVALKNFASQLATTQHLLSHSKVILLLKLEASRLSSSLKSMLVKDCIERLHSMWRMQFISPITETTRETCRDLARILIGRNFTSSDADKIASMSEFKLRRIDPTQGDLYQSKLEELKQSFRKLTVETYRSIRDSISITEDS